MLRNIYVPYNGKTSEIDVLMIREKGIFVFESKNYSGWIFGGLKIRRGHSVYLINRRVGFTTLYCKIELTLKHWHNF